MKRFLSNKDNMTRIIISIALALFLWVVSINSIDPTTTNKYSRINVDYINQDVLKARNLVVDTDNLTVDLKLYGRTIQLSRIKAADIKAHIDLSKITNAGNHYLKIELYGVPENATVVELEPAYATISVSEIKETESNFTIATTGKLADGCVILARDYDTTVVSVTGSQSLLSSKYTVKGTLDLGGKDSDFTYEAALKIYDQNDNIIDKLTVSPSTVKVSVKVGKTKNVSLYADSKGECAQGYFLKSLSISPAKITVKGKEEVLENINSLSVEPINISGKSSTFSVSASVKLPNGVTLEAPQTITVTANISAYESKSFTYDSVQIRNTPPGLSCEILDFSDITVTLISDTDALKSLNKDDIKLYINLQDLNDGEHRVPILYELPKDVYLQSINKDQLSVLLKQPE